MTLPGANDFSAQVAGTIGLIDKISVSLTLPQAFDLTSVLLTNAYGVLVVWQADPSQIGQTILVGLDAGEGSSPLGQQTLLQDAGEVLIPFPSAIVTADSAATCSISLQRPSGAPNPTIGILTVFAVMAPTLVIPHIRRQWIGKGQTTGQGTAAGSGVTTILAFPPPGTYYRIKSLTVGATAAPSSANRLQLRNLTTHDVITFFQVTTTANYKDTWNTDWETDDGLELNNPVTSGIVYALAYELWPV